ncbi:MAG TPA: ComF family protein [Planctomycetota bacterium]|nr:ComF family protein [Planctomycetota bacterium]
MGILDTLRSSLGESTRDLLDAIYPPRCRLCGATAPDSLACDAHTLPDGPPGARCPRCAAPLPRGIPDGRVCADCRRRPPGFSRLIALGDYREGEPLREWILALKHRRRPDLALPLGLALAERLRREAQPDALLVPVPLHRWRRIERGYDQALLLARAAGEGSDLRVARAQRRSRSTTAQGALGSVSRAANVRGAFAPSRRASRHRRRLEGREVWLVDDVVTSGATASECARVLRRLGAARVGVLALARAAPAGQPPADDGTEDVAGERAADAAADGAP